MRGGQQGGDVFTDLLHARFVHAVYFCNHHRAALDMQQIQNVQMFQRLRHHAVVGGHHQQRVIDAAHTGEHVAHKAFMSGNIDKADQFAVGQRQIGKAQINRNAARLFFGQAIGVHAGERFHQQRFAVIDMARSGDYHRATIISICF